MGALDGDGPGALSLTGMTIDSPDILVSTTATRQASGGAIVLVRHGEPALSRRVRLDSAGYRAWWARYELGGLLEGQTPPEALKAAAREAHLLYCSTRPRAIETARAVVGDRAVTHDAQFVEAPLPPPPLPSWIRFKPRTWGVIARLWWWTFDQPGEETKAQAKARARTAAQRLAEQASGGRQVMVLAHGFFNLMIGKELERMGWRCVRDQGFNYWSARRFEKR